MSTQPEQYTVAEASARLDKVVDTVNRTRVRAAITRDGQPVAIVISADELESIEETLAWIDDNGVAAHQESRAQFAAGDTVALEDLRAEFAV